MASSADLPAHAHALSPEEIESFVERGYLILRGCFPREVAAELVRQTLVLRSPEPRVTIRGRGGRESAPPGTLELTDPMTWGSPRLDLETTRSLPIATFAPRLWGAITSLVGPGRKVARTTMGERWILNAHFAPPPRPALDGGYAAQFDWHIDAPSERTMLDGRREALALLVAWSDIAPGGGGPLYSAELFGHTVRLLESRPDGLDTRGYAWAQSLAERCSDVQELVGEAGDVILTHALLPHAAHPNYSTRLRILENPTITLAGGVHHHTDDASASPIERAVVRHLVAPRPMPRDARVVPAEVLRTPPRASSDPARDATAIRPVPEWMAMLAGAPVERAVAWAVPSGVRVRLVSGAGPLVLELRQRSDRGVDCARITKAASTPVRRLDSADAAAFCARIRWLGTRPRGVSGAYAPSAAERRGAELSDALADVRTPDDATGIAWSDADSSDPRLRAIGSYLDVVAGRWDAVFTPLARREVPEPDWLLTILRAVSGDLSGVAHLAAGSPSEGALATVRGAALERVGLTEAARAAYQDAARAVLGPDRADVYLELADAHRALGEDVDAIARARAALLCRPLDDDLLHRVCDRIVRWGALDDARAALEERCAREPDDRRALLGLAELLLWAGRPAEARPWIERARAMGAVDDASSLRAEGILLAIEGRWAEALSPLALALALTPRSKELSTWLAEIQLRLGDRAGAARQLAEARAITQTPIHTLLNASLSNVEDVGQDQELAALLDHLEEPRWQGRPIDVEPKALELLTRFGGNRTGLLTRRRAASSDRLGIEIIRLPSHDAALASRDASAYLLKRVGTMPLAALEQAFAELAERYEASPHPLCYWGELALWLGEHERAFALFDRALGRASARWGYVGKAAARILAGDHEGGDALLAECARRFEPVVGATTHVYAGEALRIRGDHERAREQLGEAVRAKPGRAAAWINLALAHHALGSVDEARQIFSTLTERWPRLFWDASRALSGEASWPPSFERMPALFEQALVMMRGNRSSHTITYFDRAGMLRVAQDAAWWRAMLAGHTRFVAAELRDRLASGALSD